MTRAPVRPLPDPTPPEPLAGTGSGTRLWLLRHAEVHADWQGIAYGNLDVPLSDAGHEVTRERGEAFGALQPALVLGSDLARASALATAVAARAGARAVLDPGLRELFRGDWQGRRADDLRAEHPEQVDAFYADPWRFRGHGGECDAEVFERAHGVLAPALREHAGGTLVVCTHYNVIRVLAARALGVAPERSFALRVDPGRAIELEDAPFGWALHHSNVTSPPASVDTDDLTHPGHPAGRTAR